MSRVQHEESAGLKPCLAAILCLCRPTRAFIMFFIINFAHNEPVLYKCVFHVSSVVLMSESQSSRLLSLIPWFYYEITFCVVLSCGQTAMVVLMVVNGKSESKFLTVAVGVLTNFPGWNSLGGAVCLYNNWWIYSFMIIVAPGLPWQGLPLHLFSPGFHLCGTCVRCES